MNSAKTWKGEWLFPGSEKTYKGVLSFDPSEGCRLELFGDYESGSGNIPLITGRTTDGFVTLLETRYKSSHYSNETATGFAIYIPSVILEGWAFSDPSELSFTSVQFGVHNLQEWIHYNGFENNPLKGQILNYQKPVDIPFSFSTSSECKIEFGYTGEYPQYPFKVYVEQFCRVTFSYKNQTPFREILENIRRFTGLVTFCTYEHCFPTSICFFHDQLVDASIFSGLNIKRPQAINYIYKNEHSTSIVHQSNIHHWLIKYSDISAIFADVVRKWFDLYQSLDQFIKLILRAFVDKYNWSSEKFMDAARAIESFHRMHHPNRIYTKEEIKQLREQISTLAIDDKYKQMLNEKLNFAHEPTLKDRLLEMTQLYSLPYFDERVSNKESFVKTVRDWRNQFTHLDKNPVISASSIKELFDLTENINLLLFSAIATKIGVPLDKLDHSIRILVY